MKIVLNRQYGGFDLSHETIMLLAKKQGIELFVYYNKSNNGNIFTKEPTHSVWGPHYLLKDFGDEYFVDSREDNIDWWNSFYSYTQIDRTDPLLIEVIEELGNIANTHLSTLEIFEIPNGSFYEIINYDGYESIIYSESEIKII